MRQAFLAAATKGWALCNHTAQLVERTSDLGNLKLMVGSGCLEIPKGLAKKDSLDKHVEEISFWQCVAFCEHGQLKGWQPQDFQPIFAKISISKCLHWFAAVP